jgi:hypothetical protein
MAKFEKGHPGYKPKGATNKITRTVKELVLDVFNQIQDHPTANLKSFAETNPKDFYIIAAKLIPAEINAHVDNKIITVTVPNE